MQTLIPLSRPDIDDTDVAAVTEVLRSGCLSLGDRQMQFEKAMCERSGCTSALAVSSGTAGLLLCLEALGIGAADEVITVSFTFVATANAVVHRGATPVFVDIDPDTCNIDCAQIEAAITPRTKAILVVHVFGRPVSMDEIMDIADRHGLLVIEDACEALGASYNGKPAGSMAHAGVFGFYPNKIMTTAEGGVITSNDKDLIARCRRLANQGRPEDGDFVPGYNYRLSELHAALGCTQISRLDEFMHQRKRVAHRYIERLENQPGIILPCLDAPGCTVSWFVFVIRVGDEPKTRNMLANTLNRSGIQTGHYFPAIHLIPWYAHRYGYAAGSLPHTELASATSIALPFFSSLSEKDIDRVCDAVISGLVLRK